ncbi:hypothetical protein FDP41_004908 [Naegleria fowleri]|uniref:Uncharacterized protein n=1 Tax=Naegleria fowleri TaxID=5763 RepID=A0A6A5BEF6_NAEFO|nr:uncharacterized protein FDP41_004908 [Naegleria fowleri]KAF0976233.1 hypothetical protein FDP41_004908 [Naegleria fowleri]CAG4712358.1 unnamed protein product [Naegleria fowleri]
MQTSFTTFTTEFQHPPVRPQKESLLSRTSSSSHRNDMSSHRNENKHQKDVFLMRGDTSSLFVPSSSFHHHHQHQHRIQKPSKVAIQSFSKTSDVDMCERPTLMNPLVDNNNHSESHHHSNLMMYVSRKARKVHTQPYEQVLLNFVPTFEKHPHRLDFAPLRSTTMRKNSFDNKKQKNPQGQNSFLTLSHSTDQACQKNLTTVSSSKDETSNPTLLKKQDATTHKKSTMTTGRRMLSIHELLN